MPAHTDSRPRRGDDDPRAFCVLLADLIRSRKQPVGAEVQEALESTALQMNHRYANKLAAEVTITSGDELQALLRAPDCAFDLGFDLADRLHPLRLRFGAGLGELSTPLRPTTGSLSGPAFFRAREAMERARRRGWHIAFDGFGKVGPTLDVLGDCALAMAEGWTPAQRESARAYMAKGTHQAAADALGLARSTVTRNLHRGLVAQALRTREHLRELLVEIETPPGEETETTAAEVGETVPAGKTGAAPAEEIEKIPAEEAPEA